MSKNEWLNKSVISSTDGYNSVLLFIPIYLLESRPNDRKDKKKGTSGTTKEWRRGAHLQIQYRLLMQPSALTSERRQQQREWLLYWAEAGNHAAQIKSHRTQRERERDLLLSNCWLLHLLLPFFSSSSSSFSS